MIDSILMSLSEVLRKYEGTSVAWTHRNLYRAIVLIGGLDEQDTVKILEQEGV